MAKQVFNPLSGNFDLVLDKASEINYSNLSSGLAATNVQTAIDEVQFNVDSLPLPIVYKGTWDASTNTPTLLNTDINVEGFLYQVNVAGTVDFGAGPISFEIGDKVVNNSSIYQKWDMTDAVFSVNGQTGLVTLDTGDIPEGSNLYFTDIRAQDALQTQLADKANTDLSNLAAMTAINSHLFPDTDGTYALGYSLARWAEAHFAGEVSAGQFTVYNNVPAPIGALGLGGDGSFTFTAVGVNARISTLSNSNPDANPTNDVLILSGNKNDGTGDSGSINLTTGTSAGGLRGQINLDSSAVYVSSLTSNTVITVDASNNLVSSAVTDTELSYVSGVTSAIQTQLDSKTEIVTGDITRTQVSVTTTGSPTNVTGAVFAGTIRSFEMTVDAVGATQYQSFKILGIQRGSDWTISQSSFGDNAGVAFSITTGGQLQYVASQNLTLIYKANTLGA